MYKPKPINTYGIDISDELHELLDRLAENAHDVWAIQRMKDGWTYGSNRDDSAKKHPDLVPYSELPESEKEYDRKMATETIKAILALGYQIKKR